MLRSKPGLLGLCMMALSLMAIAANSASAAVEWLILDKSGTALNASALPAEIVGELENNDGTLLTKLIGLEISVLCTSATLTGTKLEGGGKLTNGGKVTFGGCTVPTPTGCTVSSVGAATGTIQSLAGKGQLQTNGETLIEPSTGITFAELVFAGATCPLPTGVGEPINGKLWIKDCEKQAATHLVKHLISESLEHHTGTGGKLGTLWIGKDTEEHLETRIDGSVEVFLAGAHNGLSWGAIFP